MFKIASIIIGESMFKNLGYAIMGDVFGLRPTSLVFWRRSKT